MTIESVSDVSDLLGDLGDIELSTSVKGGKPESAAEGESDDCNSDNDGDTPQHETKSLPEFDDVPGTPTVGRPEWKYRGRRVDPVIAAPVEGSGAPPPTPSKYEVLETSSDVNLTLDGVCKDGKKESVRSTLAGQLSRTSNPNVHVNPPAYAVDNCDGKGRVARKTWGVPMV